MYRKQDLNSMGNVYSCVICENTTQLPPEIVKAITDLVTKADAGDAEAAKMLTDPAFAEKIIRQAQQKTSQQEPVTEALEKFRSNLGAKFGGGSSIDRRYELFLKDINGHLWEIEKDSKLLNVEPKEVNKFISDIVNIEPRVDKQGKLLQKIGYAIGKGVGVAAFAAPFAIAVTYLAPTVGIYGLTAKAIAGVLAGGGRTATLLNNKQLSTQEKVGEVLKAALAAFALTQSGAGPSTDSAAPEASGPPKPLEMSGPPSSAAGAGGLGIPDPTSDIIADWPELTRTVFGQMKNSGEVLRSVSSVDETALQNIISDLTRQGLDWNTMSMGEKARLANPILKKLLGR